MLADDDTQSGLDPFGTLSEFLMCRYTRDGCTFGIRFSHGQYARARSDMDTHQALCLYQYE